MLELENQTVKVKDVNPRAEKHGEENKLACDIQCEIKVFNEFLIPFHPQLRAMLFKKGDQADLPLGDDNDRPTALNMPQIKSIKWHSGDEKDRYNVTVDYGMGGESNIVLTDCKVNNFEFTPQEGGSVFINFRIQAYPGDGDMDKLCKFIQGETKITITVPESQQLELDAPKRGRKKKGMTAEEKREALSAAFVESNEKAPEKEPESVH